MKYFVGLDVSLKETAISIVDQDGKRIHEGMVSTEPDDITVYLQSTGLSYERVGLEASNLSIWLYHELLKAEFPVICIETRHAKAAMAAQNVKTDRNDARGIAHMMRTGWYRPVHVKSNESQQLRTLLNSRRLLINKRKDIENQIRGTLKIFGLKVGVGTGRNFSNRVHELIDGNEKLEAYTAGLLRVRDVLISEIADLHKQILDYVRDDAVCQLLMTVPGIGPITALLFKTTIDDPRRFRRPRHVPVHLGLTPRKYQSGEVDYDGGITRCGDAMLRSHLYEAAMVMMRQYTKKNAAKSWGLRIAKRTSKKNALIAVARKLSIVMHRMWLDGTEFRWEDEPETGSAA